DRVVAKVDLVQFQAPQIRAVRGEQAPAVAVDHDAPGAVAGGIQGIRQQRDGAGRAIDLAEDLLGRAAVQGDDVEVSAGRGQSGHGEAPRRPGTDEAREAGHTETGRLAGRLREGELPDAGEGGQKQPAAVTAYGHHPVTELLRLF